MKVLILGCGHIGSVAAYDLARSLSPIEVFLADKRAARAEETAERIGASNVSWIQLDASDHHELVDTLREFELVMGFLPGRLGYQLVEACIEARRNLVDVSYMPEDIFTLSDKASEAGVTIVPDCGLAPGISNVLVGQAASKLDEVRAIHIMVGGLPEKPVPPLGYIITWSPENLVDEYTREVKIVKDGELRTVEALSGLERVEFPHIGALEAFYTDGLRTLLHTMKNVDDMWEKTLRYPGHAEKIRLLRDLGFFDEEQVSLDGVNLPPRTITIKLFERRLRKPEVKDITAMKVEVSGLKDSKPKRYVYYMLDRYDTSRGVTAMARTTAYPTSIAAQLILKKAIKRKGVVPPETLGTGPDFFKAFLNQLEKRGLEISQEEFAA